jgi:enamine deaminase RidA (YjgF/YER057c/UK114 family)
MFVAHNPPTVASIGAPLSWGIEAVHPKRIVIVSGQIGADLHGNIPTGFLEQAKLTWESVGAVLRSAEMSPANIVRTGIFITPAVMMTPETRAAFNKLRTDFLGENRPASTMICVHALMDPSWLIEIDAIAVAL